MISRLIPSRSPITYPVLKSPPTISFVPVVVPVASADASTFGRPRNSPSRVGIWSGSAELPPTKRYVESQVAGLAANVVLLMKRDGIAAFSDQGSARA